MMSEPIIPAVTLPVPEIPRDLLSFHKEADYSLEKNGRKNRRSNLTDENKSTDDLIALLLREEDDGKIEKKKESRVAGSETHEERSPNRTKKDSEANEINPKDPEEARIQKKTAKDRAEVSADTKDRRRDIPFRESNPFEKAQVREIISLRGPGILKELSERHFIGSDQRCADIAITGKEGKFISARHAEIIQIGDSFYIEDAGSRNGTFVNGRRIEAGRKMRIIAGDTIRLADIDFTLVRSTA